MVLYKEVDFYFLPKLRKEIVPEKETKKVVEAKQEYLTYLQHQENEAGNMGLRSVIRELQREQSIVRISPSEVMGMC